jgi:hypothetical protein
MFVKANAPADLLKQQLVESVQQWPDCALTGDWPGIDVDLHLESIQEPERFPLKARLNHAT